MRTATAAALLGIALPSLALAAVGGANYQTRYDFDELRSFTDGKPLRVEMSGNPFPAMAGDDAARQMLPLIQAARPARLRSTFTFDNPAEKPRPDYRLVLVFDAADNLNAADVCVGKPRHGAASPPGKVRVFAVYCRSDQHMSETTGWTDAAGPADPAMARLYVDILNTVFSDAQGLKPHSGGDRR